MSVLILSHQTTFGRSGPMLAILEPIVRFPQHRHHGKIGDHLDCRTMMRLSNSAIEYCAQ